MVRDIININEEICNGCGACVRGCHEGALQMINGKARIISALYCDGLGACIGDCPVGAISITKQEAEPYSEVAVMEKITDKGKETILAHLTHLKEHNEIGYLNEGIAYLEQHGIDIDLSLLRNEKVESVVNKTHGCLGSMTEVFSKPVSLVGNNISGNSNSELTHWPVQLHLINPTTSHFIGADLLVAADCVAYAYPDFHSKFLHGKKLVIACPKLDSNKERYVEKLSELIDKSKIKTLTAVIMEVPCCGGLMKIINMAIEKSERKVSVTKIVIGTKGAIKL